MIHLCSFFNTNLSVVYVGMSQIHIYIYYLLIQQFLQTPSEVYLKGSPVSEKFTESNKHTMTLTRTDIF